MSFLNEVCKVLDFSEGDLYSAVDTPVACKKHSDWLDKGEWFAAAKRAGAEKIFFVDNNPLIIFAQCSDDLIEKANLFNKIWCLARPRLLFLFTPGGLDIFDLAQKPVNIHKKEACEDFKSKAILKNITLISSELLQFHRDNIESGKVFGDTRFGAMDNRADKSLIRDLNIVRRELIQAGLGGAKVRFAHALIGRSIFIRYLEDREVLTEDYFLNVAHSKAGWTEKLKNPSGRARYDLSGVKSFYPRILSDKSFTYSLFHRLAKDFNGDMFPHIDEEEIEVKQKHLDLIQGLLYGDVDVQQRLFFFSYRFDIIPLDLISSIYEEFYHDSVNNDINRNVRRQDGAFYTPSVLAEFVLSRLLTKDILKNKPRILDPSCGSGIFLVEAFRRIVRHEWHLKGAPLTFDELKQILKNQICGIEMNPEAANIAAFSLYLSMLHYLDPPAIDKQIKSGNKLPNIVASNSKSENHFHCILPANAFDIRHIELNANWYEKFKPESFDIVVGNPPWGAPGKAADDDAKENHKIVLDWCDQKKHSIGDREQSQAFLWRGLDFLKDNGKAGMLVSSGVLFKHNTTTQAFRDEWLQYSTISEVFNFSHVREFFFKGAISPFLSLFFSKNSNKTSLVFYWAAKQTLLLKNTQAITISKQDLNILRDVDISKSFTWKINTWGRIGDNRFINILKTYPRFSDFIDRDQCGQGLKYNPPDKTSKPISSFKICPIDLFTKYDELNKKHFLTLPEKLHRLGCPDVYSGLRLLVKRGIDESAADKGQIITRFEKESFCFTNAIHGIKLTSPGEWKFKPLSPEEWKYKVVLGILWSSLARYFLFMTSSNWGHWHHEIHLDDELLQLPIILDEKNSKTKLVIQAVDKLREYHPAIRTLIEPDGISEEQIQSTRFKFEKELDEAIFSLYNLDHEQIDLIRDFCEVTLPFFYQPFNSLAGMPAINDKDSSWLSEYIKIFCHSWNAYLNPNEEMRAEIHIGAHGNLLALEFFPADKDDAWNLKPKKDSWQYVLDQLSETLKHPMGTSKILLENLVHIVSENGIIVVKRNEKRFWTRSIAREDAEATLCKRMITTMPNKLQSN
jgi:hypothetical protein